MRKFWTPQPADAPRFWRPRADDDDPGSGEIATKPAGDGVAVIMFDGALTARPAPRSFFNFGPAETMGTHQKLQAAVRSADANANASTTLIIMSSGGGEVEQTLETQAVIAGASNRVAVWTEALYSAAVVVTSGADVIAGPPTAGAGSLSVYSAAVDESKALESMGVKFVSESPDPLKKSAAPGQPIDEARRKQMLRKATEIKAALLPVVAEARGMELSDLEKVATGEEFTGQAAVDAGFLDEIHPSLEAFMATLKDRNNTEEDAEMADTQKPAAEEPAAAPPDAAASFDMSALANMVTTAVADAVEPIAAEVKQVAESVAEVKATATVSPFQARLDALGLHPEEAAAERETLEMLAEASPEKAAGHVARLEARAKPADAHDLMFAEILKASPSVQAASSDYSAASPSDVPIDIEASAFAASVDPDGRADAYSAKVNELTGGLDDIDRGAR
jgi:ClpP class serine protease